MTRSVRQRIRFGKRAVLLSDGEDVQGEPAAQGHHKLVHVGEGRQQHRREDGVSTQEQEGVAGVSNSSVIS